MALWMVYSLLVGVLFGVAAAGLESALRAWRLQARWAVAAGMLASVLMPLLVLVDPSGRVERTPAALGRGLQEAVGALAGTGILTALDGPLTVLWVASALSALTLAAVSRRRLRYLIRNAPDGAFEGIPYRRTLDFGPAVVGMGRGVIVLPAWATTLGPDPLRLALRHEQEHRRARDPALQFAGALLAMLQPWNLALWWQAFRLRQALEMDCDRRVLRSGADLRSYAGLLCDVVARRGHGEHMALAMAAHRSRLARRMERMMESSGRRRRRRAAVGAIMATTVAAGAFHLPFPRPTTAAQVVAHPRAVLKFGVPGGPGRPDSLVTMELDGEEAIQAVRAMPGTVERNADGTLVRKVIRRGAPAPAAPLRDPGEPR